ncbi:hypothetical protein HDU80_006152 [Chytriomyces hyalinus]|nr:hypothetical protein HDU80_006152 [Chytriomyces hyalinus]
MHPSSSLHSLSHSQSNLSLSFSALAIPQVLVDALAEYEPLSNSISSNYDLDDKLPVQKKLIATIMQRMEIDKKELSRRDQIVRKLLTQKDALSNQFSFSSIQASFWGNHADKEKQLVNELVATRNSLEQIKKQANETSERLIQEIQTLESMDERNSQLVKWRHQLIALMDKTFEEDKEDIALKLRILSSKSNYASSMDQFDRHKAAEAELKVSKKLFHAAMTLLQLLEDKAGEIPDWFRAKFIFDAKQLTTQADLFLQNAFSIDTTLPDHEPIPPMPSNQDTTVVESVVKTLRHRCLAKLDRIASSQAYLQAAKNTATTTLARTREIVRSAQEALNVRRVEVMETALEMWKQQHEDGHWRREKVIVAAWVLPVDEVMMLGDIEMRDRPTPGPMRIVNEVPTAADVLPEYAP